MPSIWTEGNRGRCCFPSFPSPYATFWEYWQGWVTLGMQLVVITDRPADRPTDRPTSLKVFWSALEGTFSAMAMQMFLRSASRAKTSMPDSPAAGKKERSEQT